MRKIAKSPTVGKCDRRFSFGSGRARSAGFGRQRLRDARVLFAKDTKDLVLVRKHALVRRRDAAGLERFLPAGRQRCAQPERDPGVIGRHCEMPERPRRMVDDAVGLRAHLIVGQYPSPAAVHTRGSCRRRGGHVEAFLIPFMNPPDSRRSPRSCQFPSRYFPGICRGGVSAPPGSRHWPPQEPSLLPETRQRVARFRVILRIHPAF